VAWRLTRLTGLLAIIVILFLPSAAAPIRDFADYKVFLKR